MSKILSDNEFFEKLTLAYTIKAGYLLGRAAIGDVAETLHGNSTEWRTELVLSRIAAGLLSVSAGDVLSYAIHRKQLEHLKEQRTKQAEDYDELIKNGVANKEKDYGYIELDDANNKKVWTLDAGGNVVRESLIMYYKGDDSKKQSITIPKMTSVGGIDKISRNDDGKAESEPVTTAYVFFCDLAPEITMESSKNIVQTSVQGRDYTRKELIAGGDITFSISGAAVSNNLYAYPKEEVARLLNIYQYNGIIEVKNMLFDNYGVSRILIKNLRFGEQTCKNVQPYTMQCVAIEPSDAIVKYADVNLMNNGEIKKGKDDIFDIIYKVQQTSGLDISLMDLIGGQL